jgi:hypothetical protein
MPLFGHYLSELFEVFGLRGSSDLSVDEEPAAYGVLIMG